VRLSFAPDEYRIDRVATSWHARIVEPRLVRVARVTNSQGAPRDDVRDFIPALIGRRAGEPGVWVPAAYSEEWARRAAWPCDTALETGMFRR